MKRQPFAALMRILFVAIAALLVLALTSTVWACDCVTGTPEQSFRNAEVVFHGELIRITPISNGTAYTFRVKEVFKGPPAGELTLEQGTFDCDATFVPDILYRVYARRSEGKLFSGFCSGNERIRVTRLRTVYASTSATGSSLLRLVAPAALGGLAALIWFLIRRR